MKSGSDVSDQNSESALPAQVTERPGAVDGGVIAAFRRVVARFSLGAKQQLESGKAKVENGRRNKNPVNCDTGAEIYCKA